MCNILRMLTPRIGSHTQAHWLALLVKIASFEH
jgi:hypothetical protein